jgi:CrcB protein
MYFLIGIGGALGSLTRYSLGRFINKRAKRSIPVSTFLINITGAFFLGLVISLGLGSKATALLAEGFLGSYTTFSAFMFEGFSLFRDRKHINAAIYVIGTVVLGVSFYAAGSVTAGFLSAG